MEVQTKASDILRDSHLNTTEFIDIRAIKTIENRDFKGHEVHTSYIIDHNINHLSSVIYQVTKKRMNTNDKSVLIEAIKEVQNIVQGISLEYIRFLLASSDYDYDYVISMLNSNCLRTRFKSQMKKVRKVLIENKCNFKRVVSDKPEYYFSGKKQSVIKLFRNFTINQIVGLS